MAQEDIVRMARESGLHKMIQVKHVVDKVYEIPSEKLGRFAALVAAHERERAWTEKDWDEAAEWIRQQEREACAKVCEGVNWYDRHEAAAAIRARSEK